MPFSADRIRPSSNRRPERHSVPLERAGWPRSGRAGRDLAGAGPVAFPGLHLGRAEGAPTVEHEQAERCRSFRLDDRSSAAAPPRLPGCWSATSRLSYDPCKPGEWSPGDSSTGGVSATAETPFPRTAAGHKGERRATRARRRPPAKRGRERERAGECFQHSRPVADPRIRRNQPAMTVYRTVRRGRHPHAHI